MKRNGNRILAGIYESSMKTSLVAMMVVVVLEIFMLVYSMIDTALFGPFLWTYRMFYMALLAMAVIYVAVSMYAKGNFEQRSGILRIANPV